MPDQSVRVIYKKVVKCRWGEGWWRSDRVDRTVGAHTLREWVWHLLYCPIKGTAPRSGAGLCNG